MITKNSTTQINSLNRGNMKTLVVLSHPDLESSIANKTIIEHIKKTVPTSQLEVRHLESLYPDYKIDIEKEQAALLNAGILIFQHPLYWYATPSILKKYLDDVMTWGFAYGTGGDKLKGKQFLQSITLGGSKESFTPLGYNRFSVEDILKPMQQSVYHMQMIYNLPLYSYRNAYVPEIYNSMWEVKETAIAHAKKLIEKIQDFSKGNQEKVEAFIHKWFSHFDRLDENGYFIQYLHKDVEFTFPGYGKMKGHPEFNEWYRSIKEKLEAPTKHEVQNLIIEETERNQFDIRFQVQFKAREKESQKEIDVVETENWKLIWDENSDRPIIEKYIVTI
ncbi:NAD(P)H-dependent oxidoreductase [Flavobacterium geliluteum]|uniref:NAD(P)H-dependent oxidoreductase n=1 Tax=Flavobacterium geliluteum TaxID=2816120 RepID=A0A940XFN1_9FLAO|nr:NAD(P)H-dependent oxidoreductase [Flavobacterium geliluteum]MBP4138398.1 NAD(P)H-dependent oxidoreductase [Flavobacterium geliluteum]